MDNGEIYNRLTELTEGLLYISETENEFSVYEIEKDEEDSITSMMEDIAGASAVSFGEENYFNFFEKIIVSLGTDPGMQELKQRYEALFAYLQHTFSDVRVMITNGVERNVFIICSTNKGERFLLHTLSVES